ncbi:MAG: hypothetical protein ACREBU_14935, partial [Nitrososphaera sp.]
MMDTDGWVSVDVESPDTFLSCRPTEFHLLFGGYRDLVFLHETNREKVLGRLRVVQRQSVALDLALILLDVELSATTRTEAARELAALLTETNDHLRAILYAKPLPACGDLAGALQCSDQAETRAVRRFLLTLLRFQPSIRHVCDAWNQIPTLLFGSDEMRDDVYVVLTRGGLLRALVPFVATSTALDGFLFHSLRHPIVKSVSNHRQIMQAWLAPLNPARRIRTTQVRHEEAAPLDSEYGARHRRDRPSADEVKARVDRQKPGIVEAMKRRALHQALSFVNDLVDYQLMNGDPEYACMSLCDLAVEAQALGMFSLQLRLTARSIGIKSDDAWSWAQYGKALLNMGRFDDALHAYKTSLMWRDDVLAKNGRADLLKTMNRLQEALEAYEAITREHPE